MKLSASLTALLLYLFLGTGLTMAHAAPAGAVCPLPVAPDVTATRSQSAPDTLLLRWTHQAANGGGYEVYRGATPYFTPGTIHATVDPAANAGDPLQFAEAGVLAVDNPTDYYYVVRATTGCDNNTADAAPVGFFRFGTEPQPGVSRAQAQALYDSRYEPFGSAAPAWSGDHQSCNAGTTSAAFRAQVLDLINYYRAMAGVPDDIVFSDTYNAKAQEAALMMSANGQLSHYPPQSWKCYTAGGAEAAGKSNLSMWYGYGPEYHGVIGQMADGGNSNDAVGHRRWLLCPQTETMGTGDVPQTGNYWAVNALWVIDAASYGNPRPETRDGFVAWPPPGYVPGPVVYDRWSFSYGSADFSAARVSMTHAGAPVSVRLERLATGYCENTLVWVPDVDWGALDLGSDQAFQVRVADVGTAAGTETFSYEVILFAP